MISRGEEELICDLAETYNIYDYRILPAQQLAIFANGLKSDSRIMVKLSPYTIPLRDVLLASLIDEIRAFRYSFSKDAKAGSNLPEMLVRAFQRNPEKQKSKVMAFDSPADFEKRIEELRKKGG